MTTLLVAGGAGFVGAILGTLLTLGFLRWAVRGLALAAVELERAGRMLSLLYAKQEHDGRHEEEDVWRHS